MARLNDPPVTTMESIDALKRRFIRQNREIARVNSTQSQRIRNLETEISRLLAENIALREQAIRTAEEAQRLKVASCLERDIIVLKERLEQKLSDVTALVGELGTLPERVARRSSVRRRRSGLSLILDRSPDERDWRNRQTLGGTLNPEQEGRLPAILEDKHYPRRTLDASELRPLGLQNDRNEEYTESPDLGPPPVAHFEVSDPIAFDSSRSPKRVSGGIVLDAEEDFALPPSLETRRRRRTSSLVQDMSSLQAETDGSKQEPEESRSALKAGAKRKLEASELEETSKPVTQEDFIYQRKGASVVTRPKPARFTAPSRRQPENVVLPTVKSPQKDSAAARKALAPKTTNSPTKRKVEASSQKASLHTTATTADKDLPVRISARSKIQPPLRIDLPVETAVVGTQPKTPGAALGEPLSPTPLSTEPSLKSKTLTTSEMAITNSVEDVLNGSIGRGSRRARAAVSYAEPNLRDKMRRPDKRLVGAIEGLSKSNNGDRDTSREPSESVETFTSREALDHLRHTRIKSEPDTSNVEEQGWKQLPLAKDPQFNKRDQEPTSPLREREKRQLAVRMSERRNKRTHSESEGTSSKFRATNGESEIRKSIEGLSIYDPPPSSPLTDSTTEDKNQKTSSLSGHVSHPKMDHSTVSDGSLSTAVAGSTLKTRRHSLQVQQGTNPGLMRSSSNISIRNAANSAKEDSLYAASSAVKMKRASSVQNLSNGSARPQVQKRPSGDDKTSEAPLTSAMTTRRRSMMV